MCCVLFAHKPFVFEIVFEVIYPDLYAMTPNWHAYHKIRFGDWFECCYNMECASRHQKSLRPPSMRRTNFVLVQRIQEHLIIKEFGSHADCVMM